MKTRLFLELAALMAVGMASLPAARGQQWELVDPSGAVTAAVEAERGQLLIYERTGRRIFYSRDTRFDSADRLFLGYFNFERNRVLRFPRSGTGALQTADLDDPAPRYRSTALRVRPIAGPIGGVGRPGFGPLPGEPLYGSQLPLTPGYVPPVGVNPFDPYATGYRGIGPPPQSVRLDSKTIPNPPLAPARVVFRNDGPREVQVAIIDSQNPSGTQSMRIQPAAAVEVTLERDAGARQVSHYRVITPLGEWITREFVTEVPPPIRYEVMVHEWAIQSVAIDRTGKSPNPIEDINYQGRGIGRFPLPPGPELRSGTIDVYSEARRRQNQGSIPPIVPAEDLPGNNVSPLERAILDVQRAAQDR